MKNKLILVTGGAGYIGSALIPKLLERGYRVRVLDSLLFGSEGLSSVRDRTELVSGDAIAPPDGIMNGVFGVIHLSGVSSQASASYRSPRYTDQMNHISTEIIGKMAKQAGVERFVLASSCSIYCAHKYKREDVEPVRTETDSLDIFAPYALSKRAAEEALFELMDGNFRPTMLRKGTVYGFAPKMRYDLVLNAFTRGAFVNRKITVNAAGDVFRPMVDIQDAVNAYISALELPLSIVGGEIFNVVGSNVRIGDLANEFRNIVRTSRGVNIAIEMRPFEVVLSYRADNSKFVKAFDWRPARSIQDAVLELWQKLEQGHDHANPRYYNDAWYATMAAKGLLRSSL